MYVCMHCILYLLYKKKPRNREYVSNGIRDNSELLKIIMRTTIVRTSPKFPFFSEKIKKFYFTFIPEGEDVAPPGTGEGVCRGVGSCR